MTTFQMTCECDSFNCTSSVELSLDEATEVQRSGLIFIVKGCKVGPNPTDQLITEKADYSLYQE